MSNEPDIEPFGNQILNDTTFKVDWEQVKKVKKTGQKGGVYDAPCILVVVKGFVVPVWVELTKRDYDTLRMMKIQGIKVYSCTLGKKAENGYFPRIYAGGKDW